VIDLAMQGFDIKAAVRGDAMTKDDFRERCAEADHVWEEFDQHRHPNVYACENCLTYARSDGATMRTIMCAKLGCSSPAELYMKPEKSWVCTSHFVGVIIP
jgi:hypothetical protein